MFFEVDTINLVLYFIQQTGVVFGVGAQTIVLIAYLVATRDNVVDQKEEQFGRAVLKVLKFGLLLIIVSGAAITFIHISLGQEIIVLTPAFLFKWILIGVLLATTLTLGKKPYPQSFWEGFLGANWYALFVVHVLAPLAAWTDLLVLYAIWSVGFMLAWMALVAGTRAPAPAKKSHGFEAPVVQPISTPKPQPIQPAVHTPAPQPKVVASPPAPKPTPPPQPPKPIIITKPAPPVVPVPHKPEALPPPPLPAVLAPVPQKPPTPAPPVPQKPLEQVPAAPMKSASPQDPDQNPGLPTIRVMPKTPQEIDNQHRPSSVQF